jgi:hypothetical protein
MLVAAVVGLGLIAGVGVWWTNKQRYEKTDNAYVQADTVTVSPQIDGYVAEVLVADNQRVEAGQVLVRLDASQSEAKLAQAVAKVAALEAAIRGVDDKASLEQALIAQRAAVVTSAKVDAQRAALDLQRYRALSGNGWVSDQRLQTVGAAAAQTSATVAQAEASLQAERQVANSLTSAKAQTSAEAAAARAAMQQAKIEVERTVIRAPVSGRVVELRVFSEGGVVQAGQPILDIVPDAAPLVVRANFDPSDIDGVYEGRQAEVKFLNLHERDLPILLGNIRNVSADSLVDEKSGRSYFTAEIVVPQSQIAMLKEVRGADTGIRAGVPVSVLVKLRPRTALQYMLDPLTEAFRRSLHER